MRDRIVASATISLTRRSSLVFIAIFSAIVLVDSTIVRFSSFSGNEPSTLINVATFGTFFAILVATNILLINSVRKLVARFEYKLVPPFDPRYFYYVIGITLLFTFVIISTILLQMTLLHEYYIIAYSGICQSTFCISLSFVPGFLVYTMVIS